MGELRLGHGDAAERVAHDPLVHLVRNRVDLRRASSVQFLLGYFLYREPFDAVRLQAFAVIWCGLVIYTADGFWVQRHTLLKGAGAS